MFLCSLYFLHVSNWIQRLGEIYNYYDEHTGGRVLCHQKGRSVQLFFYDFHNH